MGKIIIDLLSDTHTHHEDFECSGGDILIHAGDVSARGRPGEIYNFIEWFSRQPYQYKIFIPGNHDLGLEDNFDYWKKDCDDRGIILLNDSGITAKVKDQEIKIWGSPVQPWFHNWAFNRSRTQQYATAEHPWIKPHWDMIPNDTEILITHGPPYKILDQTNSGHVGCEELVKRIPQTDIKLHVFGHIHEAAGFQYIGDKTYVNAARLNRMHYPISDKPFRVIREIFQDGSIGYVV